jgi:hypothetical protein
MQIKRGIPKCATCGAVTINVVKCDRALVNGCNNYYCLLTCWAGHSKGHQDDWDREHPLGR